MGLFGKEFDVIICEKSDPDWSGFIKTYPAPNIYGTISNNGILYSGEELTVVEMAETDYRWVRVIAKDSKDDPNAPQMWIYMEELNSNNETSVRPLTVKDEAMLQSLLLDKKIYQPVATNYQNKYGVYTENQYLDEYRNEISTSVIVNGITRSDETAVNAITTTSASDTYTRYIKLATKAYGAPPQWTQYVDPRVIAIDSGIQNRNDGKLGTSNTDNSIVVGRKYADTIVSNPTIISLCPGVIEYNSVLQQAVADWTNAGADENALSGMLGDVSGQLVQFQQAWSGTTNGSPGYLEYVDTLFKATVAAMSRVDHVQNTESTSIMDKCFPGTSTKYINFRWADYDGSDKAKYNYINFFGTGQNNVREEFSTDTRSSSIEDLVENTLSSTIKDISFITGSTIGDGVQEDLMSWFSGLGEKIGGLGAILSNAAELFKGGHIIFPKIIDDCTYGKSMTFTCRFVAASGDSEDRLLNVMAPFCHILPFVLPRQAKGLLDMYTMPFLVRGFARGLFSCNIGVLTNFQVTKGGQDDSAWTGEGQPTEIEVSFDITPLYTKLMLSSYSELNTMFLRNYGMIEYVSAICGVDMRESQFDLKIDMVAAFGGAMIVNTAPNWLDGILYNNPIAQTIRSMTSGF